MVFLGKIIGRPGSVRAQFSSTDIRLKLKNKNLTPKLFLTVHQIKGLSVEKFNGLISLVDKLREHGEVSAQMKLLLPPAKHLNKVDFDRLLDIISSDPKAMEKVYQSCFLQGGFIIDFRLLEKIYANLLK
jgi:hypothetical protein